MIYNTSGVHSNQFIRVAMELEYRRSYFNNRSHRPIKLAITLHE
jgi:hypothetical protein